MRIHRLNIFLKKNNFLFFFIGFKNFFLVEKKIASGCAAVTEWRFGEVAQWGMVMCHHGAATAWVGCRKCGI